jgi:hypothetical protein
MHTCNPSTEEAGRRGSHKCEASLGLHNSTLSQKQNKNSSNFSIIESQFWLKIVFVCQSPLIGFTPDIF